MRDKISFTDNMPTQVVLASAGELQRNKAGDDEYRYFLGGDRIMWVPPEVHGAIETAQAGDGAELTITRHRTKRGAAPRWTVELTQDEPYQQSGIGRASSTRPPSTPATRTHYDTTPAPAQCANCGDPATATKGTGSPICESCAAALTGPAPAARPRPTPATEAPLTSTAKMAGALAAAIDAAAEATVYGARRGINLVWGASDIRAMAATLYIDASKGGR